MAVHVERINVEPGGTPVGVICFLTRGGIRRNHAKSRLGAGIICATHSIVRDVFLAKYALFS